MTVTCKCCKKRQNFLKFGEPLFGTCLMEGFWLFESVAVLEVILV